MTSSQTPLKVTIDSGAAHLKLLNKLEKEGLITFEFINLENAKENVKNGAQKWKHVELKPAIGMYDVSRYDDGDVYATADAPDISTEINKIIGGGRHNLDDRRQLLAHALSGNDIFVTGDKDDVYNNRDLLAEVGIVVLHVDQLEEYARARVME